MRRSRADLSSQRASGGTVCVLPDKVGAISPF
jgi:hypothetical protein